MKLSAVTIAAFAASALASPAAPAEQLEKRYTDWPGCMSFCNTPTCAIKNCYQWCKNICCRTYPTYPSC